MKEQKKKKMSSMTGRKLRSAIVMALVCVLMLSGATYAWFTLSNTAKVNNLTLKVTSEGSLLVYSDNTVLKNGSNILDLTPAGGNTQVIYPCTTSDGVTMKKPKYVSDNQVGSAETIAETEKSSYYYEKEFYMGIKEATGAASGTYAITLGKGTDLTEITRDGTYVISQTVGKNPDYCVRISFTLDGGTTAVYEPNSNGTISITNDKAINNAGSGYGGTNLHQQNTAGNFIEASGTGYYENDSTELFRITGNTPTKVTMRVWFEGTDDQCGNSIQDAQILSQLKFVSHKVN